jgi:Phosphate-selective porin O and P
MALGGIPTVSAQVTPAAGYTPPDDTPSIRVGTTIYPNYTYQSNPPITDADGNTVNRSSFDVSRAYINITGNISHIVNFRVTPDITREGLATSSLSGSLVFRIKYAFVQTNFDDWMTRGSWARFGIQQTPYLDYTENIYRYRFQGTMFVERAGYFASADAGASFHYNFPSNYGDVHVGVYNGENYNRAEVNDQKAIMVRATVRPLAKGSPVLRGLRASIFYDGDNYLTDGPRQRLLFHVTYEHTYFNAAYEYLDTHDQTSAKPGTAKVEGKGYSIWATPKLPKPNGSSWEALLRYDHLTPNESNAFAPLLTAGNLTTPLNTQLQNRSILGAAYWFPHQGNVSTAILFDWDYQHFTNITTAPVQVFGIHGLINF